MERSVWLMIDGCNLFMRLPLTHSRKKIRGIAPAFRLRAYELNLTIHQDPSNQHWACRDVASFFSHLVRQDPVLTTSFPQLAKLT